MEHGILVLVFVGRPGSGKSFMEKSLLKALPDKLEIFRGKSYTTREPRDGDVSGEYAYISSAMFERMNLHGEFAWSFNHGDYRVGTRWSDIHEALAGDKISIMTLVPEAVRRLVEIVEADGVLCFFCEAPEHQCIARIKARHSPEEEKMLKRFESTKRWKPGLLTPFGAPVYTIDTSDTYPPGEQALGHIQGILRSHGV